jgi:uncharacterized protein YgbK (DUF1537 family)
MNQRCLLIADDLTGGADAGAQFAKRSLRTLLISLETDTQIDFSTYAQQDVLVVNTDSRGLSPERAYSLISRLLRNYQQDFFPILYKKIDSTLRGNIGYEIDAILKETEGSLCFMAPSYPEQNRTLVGGIMIVGEKPLALTEVARKTASPVQESHVYKILQNQSRNRVGWIDLTHVASSSEGLQKAVEKERQKGSRIIIFDAVSRHDLNNVADVAFLMERKPLFVGSAGLAEEVAKKLSPLRGGALQTGKPYKYIFIISGTASSVSHEQLKRIENRNIPVFQLSPSSILANGTEAEKEKKEFSEKIANSLSRGITLLKTPSEMLHPKDSNDLPIHLRITRALATVVLLALKASRIEPPDLAIILTGGETAQQVITGLGTEGIGIEGELLEGIVKGHLIGGNWDGLSVITKAGAFGKEDALERIVEMLEAGSPLTREGMRHEGLSQR